MSATTLIQARIDVETKQAAERILAPLGLSVADATRLFFHQIVLRNDLPISVSTCCRPHIPNKETCQALQEAENGEDLHSVNDIDAFFDSFKK